MSSKVVYYGLWQTQIEVEQKLSELTVKEQVEALKSQLNFRKYRRQDCVCILSEIQEARSGAIKEQCIRAGEKCSGRGSNRPLLVGKRVLHKFDEGEWIGKVISVVPGYVEWYNIIYEGDNSVYTYRLQENYSKGDLRIMIGNERPYVEQ